MKIKASFTGEKSGLGFDFLRYLMDF